MMKKWILAGWALGLAASLPVMAGQEARRPSGDASESGNERGHGAHASAGPKKGHQHQRVAKREARLAALQSKQSSGSLNHREQRQLARLEKWNADRVQKQRHHAREG